MVCVRGMCTQATSSSKCVCALQFTQSVCALCVRAVCVRCVCARCVGALRVCVRAQATRASFPFPYHTLMPLPVQDLPRGPARMLCRVSVLNCTNPHFEFANFKNDGEFREIHFRQVADDQPCIVCCKHHIWGVGQWHQLDACPVCEIEHCHGCY